MTGNHGFSNRELIALPGHEEEVTEDSTHLGMLWKRLWLDADKERRKHGTENSPALTEMNLLAQAKVCREQLPCAKPFIWETYQASIALLIHNVVYCGSAWAEDAVTDSRRHGRNQSILQ
ncbi:uncharacterized protein M8220_009338 [Acridotheres tristis]